MYGSGVGSLQVLLKREHGTPRSVWVMRGNQGQSWKKAEIDIDMDNHFSQVIVLNVCCRLLLLYSIV